MEKVYFEYLNNVLAMVQRYYSKKQQLSLLPEGKLQTVNSSRDGVLYYNYFNGKQIYIGKRKTDLVNSLKRRALLEKDISCIEEALDLIFNEGIYILLSKLSAIENRSFPASVSEENYKREELKHKTAHGELVRTKSEVIIANILYELGIKYCYEKKLTTPYGLVFPDFTITHPFTKRIYYLEHLGMMDDDKYANNWIHKLNKYESIGIRENNTLITTTEDKGNIDSDNIRIKLEELFTVKRFEPIIEYMQSHNKISHK